MVCSACCALTSWVAFGGSLGFVLSPYHIIVLMMTTVASGVVIVRDDNTTRVNGKYLTLVQSMVWHVMQDGIHIILCKHFWNNNYYVVVFTKLLCCSALSCVRAAIEWIFKNSNYKFLATTIMLQLHNDCKCTKYVLKSSLVCIKPFLIIEVKVQAIIWLLPVGPFISHPCPLI